MLKLAIDGSKFGWFSRDQLNFDQHVANLALSKENVGKLFLIVGYSQNLAGRAGALSESIVPEGWIPPLTCFLWME